MPSSANLAGPNSFDPQISASLLSPLSLHPSTDLTLRHSIYPDLWRSLALSLATIGEGLLQGQSSVMPREI